VRRFKGAAFMHKVPKALNLIPTDMSVRKPEVQTDIMVKKAIVDFKKLVRFLVKLKL
jgi:hypothetical protein